MVGTENFENFLFYMKFDALNNEFWVEDDLKQFNWFNLRSFEVKKWEFDGLLAQEVPLSRKLQGTCK